MSKADDAARLAKIKEDPAALAMLKHLEKKVKPERRLFPDLYVLELAEAAREAEGAQEQFIVFATYSSGRTTHVGGYFNTFESAAEAAETRRKYMEKNFPENKATYSIRRRVVFSTEWEDMQ